MQQGVIGKVVDTYRITKVLGKGGMGVVYQARDLTLDRDVALKLMDSSLARDENFLKRFQSEARALAKLQNPNIVSVFAMRETEFGFCIVMEYVEGMTLAEKIGAMGALPVGMAVPLFRQMLTALDHAHSVGVIHRDIKPSNVMLTPQNAVKVTDFGLAKIQQSATATVTLGTGGTLYYMSPEQVRGLGNVDHRGDIYSLGMTLYETVAGKVPFADAEADFAIRQAIVEGKIRPPDSINPDLPAALVRIIMRSIDKDPEKRYQSAAEMREALEKFEPEAVREDAATEGQRTRLAAPTGRRSKKRHLLVAGGIIALFAAAIMVYVRVASPSETVLTLTSMPDGSAVWIDGDSVGVTPLLFYALQPGSKAVSVRREGFRQKDTTVIADPGIGISLAFVLERIPMGGAEPAEVLPPPDSRDTPVDAVTRSATLLLRAVPGGSVTVEGKTTAATGLTELRVPPGRRAVTFQHPQYGSKTFMVDLTSGQRRSITCYFVHYVSIVSNPVWGTVVVDGAPTGRVTPLDRYPLGAGTHTVTVTRTGYETVEGVREVSFEPAMEEQVLPLVFTLRKQ